MEEEEVISSAPITIKKLGHFKCGIPALITHPHHLLSFYKTVHSSDFYPYFKWAQVCVCTLTYSLFVFSLFLHHKWIGSVV